MTFIELYDETKAAFAACQKSGRRQYYPKTLKDNAVKLLDFYSMPVLTSTLGVTGETLRDWQNKLKATSKAETEFVEVSVTGGDPKLSGVKPVILGRCVSLKIQLPNKLELVLSEQSILSACEFVSTLVKEFDACSI